MPVRSSDLILVCLVPSPRDLEIARLLGWYRIPLRTAPKVVAVDRLAFYQPSSFGEHAGQIECTAAVRGHELTTRRELLKDEPDHPRADEEYYKIQVASLERLPTPILADTWRRLTFLYTTGEYLLNAHSLDDLVVKSNERSTLWHSLRERAGRTQGYETVEELPEIPEAVLRTMLGINDSATEYEVESPD